MAKKEFILQGFTARTHLDAIKELFLVKDIDQVIISVAFVSKNGVDQIRNELQSSYNNLTIFAGIRNDITSYQALYDLFTICSGPGSLYVVDPGTRSILFHPKLYIAIGKSTARLIIGSANLTLGGLHNNIEAGMLIEFDLSDPSDKQTVDSIRFSLNSLPINHPSNVGLIEWHDDIKRLLADGRIIDESIVRPTRASTSSGTTATDNVPRIILARPPLRPTRVPQAPAAKAVPAHAAPTQKPPATSSAKAAPIVPPLPSTATLAAPLELVWESSPLKARSLQLGTGNSSTNSTGSANLGKGLFTHIDQVTYFRNNIFGSLPWMMNSNGTTETVDHDFDIVIRGVMAGTFSLTLRHSLTRVAKASKDANIPTGLSWNLAKPFVAKAALLGATMRIWRSTSNNTKFRIDID